MDILSVLTNELKEVLSNAKNESEVENIIFEHIRSAEEKNYDFPDFPSGSCQNSNQICFKLIV